MTSRRIAAPAIAVAIATIAAGIALGAARPGLASARGWSAPVRLGHPGPDPTRLWAGYARTGEAGVGFAFADADAPASARGWFGVLPVRGTRHTAAVSGARDVLDVGHLDGAWRLLIGAGSGACCHQLQAVTLGSHGPGRAQTLVRDTAGAAEGRLAAAGSGTLAALATDAGVWVALAPHGRPFSPNVRLAGGAAVPETLAAVALRGGRTAVAYTASTGRPARVASQRIFEATGSAQRAPHAVRTAVRAASGHTIDDLALASGPTMPTAAWVEDYNDSTGAFLSDVVLADLSPNLRPRTYPQGPGTVASAMTAANDPAGDEVVAWKACDTTAACQVLALTRSAHGHFGRPVVLGAIDASADPAVAVAPGGEAAAGWIASGHVTISLRRSSGGGFGAPRALAGGANAQSLTLAAGPRGRFIAAWSAGLMQASIEAAIYRP